MLFRSAGAPALTEWQCIRLKQEDGFIRRADGAVISGSIITAQKKLSFFNSHLYFHARDRELSYCIATVDTEAETWMNFGVPGGGLVDGFIQCSQGRMHYANFYRDEDNVGVRLAVYVLENCESKEWILKHVVEASVVFGGIDVIFGDLDVLLY